MSEMRLLEELRTGGVEALMRESHKIGLLSEKEQRKRIREYQETGDEQALAELVLCHVRFVIQNVTQYVHGGMPLADLVMAGVIGVMKAAERFDMDRKGNTFLTYAAWYIMQEARTTLRTEGHLLKLPAQKVLEVGRLVKKLGRDAAMDTLAATEPGIHAANHATISLHSPAIKGDDGSEELLNMVEGESGFFDPEQGVTQQSDNDWIMGLMKTHLTRRERIVLTMRYNLDGAPEGEQTLHNIGLVVGLTRERVRQVQRVAEGKLKKALKKRGVEDIWAVA